MSREQTLLALACVAAGAGWAALALVMLVGRLRGDRERPAPAPGSIGEWQVAEGRYEIPRLGAVDAAEARGLLERGLRSDEAEVRVATITALGGLGARHEWAVDGLIEALAEGIESPATVAAQLDGLAPRPGARLTPLLGHPNDIVRFYALRLLTRYPALARRHAPDLTRDASPHVRAAALDALRAGASGEALRCAVQLLEDAHPRVRAHATRTAADLGGVTIAPLLVPLLADGSWWVREAARESLVAVGKDVSTVVLPVLDDEDALLRDGAALVLQDVGLVDALVWEGTEPDDGQLERILAAGGQKLREAAAERASRGLVLGAQSVLGLDAA